MASDFFFVYFSSLYFCLLHDIAFFFLRLLDSKTIKTTLKFTNMVEQYTESKIWIARLPPA